MSDINSISMPYFDSYVSNWNMSAFCAKILDFPLI